MGAEARQHNYHEDDIRIGPPDLPNVIEGKFPKSDKEVYNEKVVALQKKLATLPPNETLNLTPLILRTRELGKQDPKRAIAYAEVALEVLNAPQETGTKEPLLLLHPQQTLLNLLASQILHLLFVKKIWQHRMGLKLHMNIEF